MKSEKGLSNAYVQEYYDAQVGQLASYTKDRWHSSPVREFEFRQTGRALARALAGRTYRQALEIGPGDGVWTGLIRAHVSGPMHLVEQSGEMLARARKCLAPDSGITFEQSDFLTSSPPAGNDLIVAMRCFEYFDDKPAALRKMRDLLAPGGTIVIVTKNPELRTSQPVQHQRLHSDQVSRARMQQMAADAGLRIVHAYPAVIRWKAAFVVSRLIFDTLHRVGVWTQGRIPVPFVATRATESYAYILQAAA